MPSPKKTQDKSNFISTSMRDGIIEIDFTNQIKQLKANKEAACPNCGCGEHCDKDCKCDCHRKSDL